MKKRQLAGFTLIELLVVIFIIGVLAGILLPNLFSARQRGRDARRKADLATIKDALRLYYNDHQAYPQSITFGASWQPYLTAIPNDPLSSQTYGYCAKSDGESFLLWAKLENGSDPDINTSQQNCPSSLCDSDEDGCNRSSENCYYICSQ